MTRTTHVLNGPNLNLLDRRQPELYGRETLEDVERRCRAALPEGFELLMRRSKHERVPTDSSHEAHDGPPGSSSSPASTGS